jgi:cytochrome b subunit of formate dehydrogenase
MQIEKLCALLLVFLGLVEFIFAKTIFNFARKFHSSRFMHFERWPAYGPSAWIWMMRIFGLFLAVTGTIMFFKEN